MSRINAVNREYFDDPVAAYDRLAASYGDLSRKREAYLRGVEREIVSRVPSSSQSLLDVGSGDGARAFRIASNLQIKRVVLVEPSSGMASHSAECAEVWPVRAEELASVPIDGAEPFDVITCLWNVLGHVPTAEKRKCALAAIAGRLAPHGQFFLDVNHRYNIRSYGLLPTTARWICDRFSPSETNGDVRAEWNTGDARVSAYGHVFTHHEITDLAAKAGLEMEERVVVDYETGRTCRFSFQGNLLYLFRRSSRIVSSSVPHTS